MDLFVTTYILLQLLFCGGFSAKEKDGSSNSTVQVYNQEASKELVCLYKNKADKSFNTRLNTRIVCRKNEKYCFAVVSVVKNDSGMYETTIHSQGCWAATATTDHIDEVTKCTKDREICTIAMSTGVWDLASDNRIRAAFCCCNGSLCNAQIAYTHHSTMSQPQPSISNPSKTKNPVILGIISSVFVITLLFIIVFVGWKCASLRKNLHLSLAKPEKNEDSEVHMPLINPDRIMFGDILHKGHFSTVRRTVYEGQVVAAKLFTRCNFGQWHNEYDVYRTLGDHPNIAKFITAFEVPVDNESEGMLLLEYYPRGSLLQFLKERTLTWEAMCQMTLSLANGLAYIHGEVNEYAHRERTVVVHRDLNSRNVLVDQDGECVLADFGFALHIVSCEGQPSAEVGTIRYMPPEMLGGAVNCKDWQSALKQADVYALGLVLWEIARRCEDVYTDKIVAAAKLPYEEELGSHPSADQVHELVVHQQERPSFPKGWNDDDMACHLLRDTIEECWDQEPEARLTALCVVRRVQEIMQCKGKVVTNSARKVKARAKPIKYDTSTQTERTSGPTTHTGFPVEGNTERASSNTERTSGNAEHTSHAQNTSNSCDSSFNSVDVNKNESWCKEADCCDSKQEKMNCCDSKPEKMKAFGSRNQKKNPDSDVSLDREYCSLDVLDNLDITTRSQSLPPHVFAQIQHGTGQSV